MYFEEVDYRGNWLRQLFAALTGVIQDIERRLDDDKYYDGTDAKEDTEAVLGIAFVAAETYIVGTCADLNGILKRSRKKDDLLKLDVIPIVDGVTRMQLVHGIANYYKHHDEWNDWTLNERNKSTISILNSCGITKETPFPCYAAATLLWPELEIEELSYLLLLLEDWRERVFRTYVPDWNRGVPDLS